MFALECEFHGRTSRDRTMDVTPLIVCRRLSADADSTVLLGVDASKSSQAATQGKGTNAPWSIVTHGNNDLVCGQLQERMLDEVAGLM